MDIHRVNNLLGIIRNKCEGFVLDTEQGLLKDKTAQEREATALLIMKEVNRRVDEITEHLRSNGQKNDE